MKGPIRPISRERLVSRADAQLPTAWFGRDSPSTGAVTRGTWVFRDDGVTQRVDRGAPALVLLAGDHPGIVHEFLAHAEAGERVYVLAPAGWGKGELAEALVSCRCVLIRRLPEVPFAGVLRASDARVWAGSRPGGPAPWCLRLDESQAAAFRQVFLRLFWHEAVDEAWSGGKALAFRPVGERPFDVPQVLSTAPLRITTANTSIEGVSGGLVHVNAGAPPSVAPRRLWIPVSGDHHRELAELRRRGSEVVWTHLDLPDVMIDEGAGRALLPGSRGRLRVELNAGQIQDLTRILSQSPCWRFDVDVRLGDHAAHEILFRLPGSGSPAPLEREQRMDAGAVRAGDVRSTPETEPASWPTPGVLALAVRYQWIVRPPRLPAGATEDRLITQWRGVDAEWSARIARIREAMKQVEEHRGRLGRFARLKSALLGFESAHNRCLRELEAIAKRTPSREGPSGAPGLLEKLDSLEETVREFGVTLETSERKAREDEEREKQEREWKVRVSAARSELPSRRATLAEAEGNRSTLVTELAEVDAALSAATKDMKKDLKARQRRVSDDLSKLEREIKRLNAEVAELEGRAAETFEFKPPLPPPGRPARGAGRFVPEVGPGRQTASTPDEALPAVGDLRYHQKKRYLVITSWEELEPGEREASRLGAFVVVEET